MVTDSAKSDVVTLGGVPVFEDRPPISFTCELCGAKENGALLVELRSFDPEVQVLSVQLPPRWKYYMKTPDGISPYCYNHWFYDSSIVLACPNHEVLS